MLPFRALIAPALGLALFAAGPARAGDAPAKEPRTIQWIDGWAAGRKAAAERGRLMLVYVHRNTPN